MGDTPTNWRRQLADYVEQMTQAEFARRVGMSESHLSLILADKRNVGLGVAARLSRETGIPVEAFVEAD